MRTRMGVPSPGMRRYSAPLAVALLLSLAAPATAAEDPAPALTLRKPTGSIKAQTDSNRWVSFPIPLWVQAPERAFELHVGRSHTADPIAVNWQSEAGAMPLPAFAVEDWNGWGLKNFFDISVRDIEGNKIRHRRTNWCPAGYERARIAPNAEPERYPQLCGGGNPFTRYQVWGLERGWAVNSDLWSQFKMKPGFYWLEVRVTKPYREALRLEPTLQTYRLTVTQGRGGGWAGPKPQPIDRVVNVHEGRPGGPTSTGAERPVITNADPEPDPSTISDLASVPAWNIQLVNQRGRETLTFAATVWNAGPAPLMVDGFRRGSGELMDAYQSFVDESGDVVGYGNVGTFEWDPRRGHTHWHFTDFARYQLLDAGEGEVVRSTKEAFCLAPTDAEDLLIERAEWRPGNMGFSQCGWKDSISIREVLPAGWGDTYMQWTPGQSFDVTDLPDGDYFLETMANPDGKLFDVTPSNDRALRALTLSHVGGQRIVSVAPYVGPL